MERRIKALNMIEAKLLESELRQEDYLRQEDNLRQEAELQQPEVEKTEEGEGSGTSAS